MMSTNPRTVIEGLQHQGQNEKRTYRVQTTPWGMTAALPPTTATAKIYEAQTGLEVSAKLDTPTCTIESDTKIKTGLVQDLEPGKLYRVEVQFLWQGNTLEYYILIECDTNG